MKSLKFICGSAAIVALLALGACNHEEPENNEPETEFDDVYWADQASVTCEDDSFSVTDDGGAITFKTDGGAVTVGVDCGTEWTYENTASDLFTVTAATASITITAGQNTVEETRTGTISLYTAAQHIGFATITVTQNAYDAPELTIDTDEWNAPAVGILSIEIGVETNLDDYDIEITGDDVTVDWLTAEKTAEGITLTASENTETEGREATVTLTATDGIKSATASIAVTQDPKAYITLSEYEYTFDAAKGTHEITAEYNQELWGYSYTSTGWLLIGKSGNTLTLSASKNESGEDRENVVTVFTTDGAENEAEVTLTVRQTTDNSMVLVYTTTDDNDQVVLPLAGTVNCTVNWGDGSDPQTYTSANPKHTYATAGEYEVTIDGTVTSLNSKNSWIYSSDSFTAVKRWGDTGLTDLSYAFYYGSGLKSLADVPEGTFAEVTSCEYMFYQATSIATLPDAMFSGCSKITSFKDAFEFCYALKSLPDNIFKGCTGVTTFKEAFRSCQGLTTLPENLFADCSSCTDFSSTFNDCQSLTALPAGMFTNCSAAETLEKMLYSCNALKSVASGVFDGCTGVTSMSYLFYGCSSLTSIPENLFSKCVNVTTFDHCFTSCSKLTTVPASTFSGCSAATNFTNVFSSCNAFATIPEKLFADCPNVTSFSSAFNGCLALTTITSDVFSYSSKVTDLSTIFSGCTKITAIPEELFAKNTEVTNVRGAFSSNKALTSIPAKLFDNNLKIENFQTTFSGCASLTGESPYTTLSDGTTVHLYERNDHTADLGCSTVTDYTGCFTNCSGLTDYSTIPSDWGGGGD